MLVCEGQVRCIVAVNGLYDDKSALAVQTAPPPSSNWLACCRIGYSMIKDAEESGKIFPGKVRHLRTAQAAVIMTACR